LCSSVAQPDGGTYNLMGMRAMKAIWLHPWETSPTEARQIQREMAGRVSRESAIGELRLIAGADVAAGGRGRSARAAVVVLSYPALTLVETRTVELPLRFPYIPGLLSFRESPVLVQAFEQLEHTPDLVMVDGQGIAHPRRIGIASHLGLLLDLPTIGCAKSRLIGQHDEVGAEPGCWTPLIDEDEVIGAVVRTKAGARPLYISIGHKVDLDAAVSWVLGSCRGYRLPEPTRLADRVAGTRDVSANEP